MHYLPLRLTLYLYGGVCAVGAGGYAVFAYRGAAQAALRFRLAALAFHKPVLAGKGLPVIPRGGGVDHVALVEAYHRVRKAPCIGNGFNNRCRPAKRVARGIYSCAAVKRNAPVFVRFGAVCTQRFRVRLFAHGGYYGIRGDGHGLISFRYAAPAAFVKSTKFHLFADEHAVLLFNGGKELGKFDPVLRCECKLLLICGHIFLCAAVNYAHLFNAHALCRAGCVHCRVAAAYNRNRIAQGKRFGRVLGAV